LVSVSRTKFFSWTSNSVEPRQTSILVSGVVLLGGDRFPPFRVEEKPAFCGLSLTQNIILHPEIVNKSQKYLLRKFMRIYGSFREQFLKEFPDESLMVNWKIRRDGMDWPHFKMIADHYGYAQHDNENGTILDLIRVLDSGHRVGIHRNKRGEGHWVTVYGYINGRFLVFDGETGTDVGPNFFEEPFDVFYRKWAVSLRDEGFNGVERYMQYFTKYLSENFQ